MSVEGSDEVPYCDRGDAVVPSWSVLKVYKYKHQFNLTLVELRMSIHTNNNPYFYAFVYYQ